jgi:hypothetical protein
MNALPTKKTSSPKDLHDSNPYTGIIHQAMETPPLLSTISPNIPILFHHDFCLPCSGGGFIHGS